MGRLGTYQAEVKVSGLWLEPEVDEDIQLSIEWTVENETSDGFLGNPEMYASYGTKVTKLNSAYGVNTGADYTDLLEKSSSHRFLNHLADVVNETYEC